LARDAGTSKYFARYAEPEALLATGVSASYGAALVVPLCRESSEFLANYDAALRASPGRVLLVCVVNAAEDASAETHAVNRALLADFSRNFPERVGLRAPGVSTQAWLGRAEHFDLLCLDRASPRARLPPGEGVGLARKLGADLAVRLWSRGQIACAQIGCSDADATLPRDYFARLERGAMVR
jgi:hypothetical protein